MGSCKVGEGLHGLEINISNKTCRSWMPLNVLIIQLYGVTDCVIHHAYVHPEINDWGIVKRITFSNFYDVFQRIVFVLQWPSAHNEHVVLSGSPKQNQLILKNKVIKL